MIPVANIFALENPITMLLTLVVWVVPLALFLWALIDALRRTFPEPSGKIVWVLVIILLPCLGPILWFAVGRRQAGG